MINVEKPRTPWGLVKYSTGGRVRFTGGLSDVRGLFYEHPYQKTIQEHKTDLFWWNEFSLLFYLIFLKSVEF